MKYLFLNGALLLFPCFLSGQVLYPDASVRLHEVWSRVADIYGELGSIESAEFSPDGRFIVSGSKFDNSIILWRTSDGAEIWRQYTEQEIERVGWTFDGKYVASASEDHLVQIWEAESGKLFKEILHEQGIDGLAWANHKMLLVTGEEGKLVKTASGEKTEAWIKVFEMPDGKEIFKKDLGGTINEIMFTDDDQFILAAGHGFVKVFRTETMEEIQSLKAESFVKFVTADFSPDGQFIAAAGFGGNVYVWDWRKGELIKRFNYRGRKEESLTWHPNGEYLITSGHGSYINIFRKKDIFESAGDEVQVAAQVFANDGAEYIHFNRTGNYMVSAHQDGIIRLWVWKGEDPNLNATRHRWVSEQQKKANEDKSKE